MNTTDVIVIPETPAQTGGQELYVYVPLATATELGIVRPDTNAGLSITNGVLAINLAYLFNSDRFDDNWFNIVDDKVEFNWSYVTSNKISSVDFNVSTVGQISINYATILSLIKTTSPLEVSNQIKFNNLSNSASVNFDGTNFVISKSLLPVSNNALDIGSSSFNFKNGHFSGQLYTTDVIATGYVVATNMGVSGNLTITGSLTDGTNSFTIAGLLANIASKLDAGDKTELQNAINLKADKTDVVKSLGGKQGEITLGTGLSINSSNVLSVDGVETSYDVVQTLPVTGDPHKIYLVPIVSTENDNEYEEYIWVQVSGVWQYEMLGSTRVDLTNYYTKSEVDGKFTNYYNKTETDNLLNTKTTQVDLDNNILCTLTASDISDIVDTGFTIIPSSRFSSSVANAIFNTNYKSDIRVGITFGETTKSVKFLRNDDDTGNNAENTVWTSTLINDDFIYFAILLYLNANELVIKGLQVQEYDTLYTADNYYLVSYDNYVLSTTEEEV